MASTGAKEIEVQAGDRAFDDAALARLAEILPDFLATRRWYRAKARSIRRVEIEDVFRFPEIASSMLVIRIEYTDSGSDSYLLPVSLTNEQSNVEEEIAKLVGRDGSQQVLYGGLFNPEFRNFLISAIACETQFRGRSGKLTAFRTSAFEQECGGSTSSFESSVSRAEQSNTSIIYQDRFILKLFRKLESGLNPDIEIGRFLTERSFQHTPAVLGGLEYRPGTNGDVHAAAILQAFVRNRGDAWKYTLDSLAGFFDRALSSGGKLAPALQSQHPFELMNQDLPADAGNLIGAYLESARLLGARTAQMHQALTDEKGGPDFAPERFTEADGRKLYDDMLSQADIAFELIRRKRATLPSDVGESAQKLLNAEHRVTERFAPLRDYPIRSLRIRHHGDYHLGQVLYTGDDFMIIDFEGEPARSLVERRLKTLAMRDVAGMIRSFQYAAYAALFGQVPGVPAAPETQPLVESWAEFWTAWVSAVYLKSYLTTAGDSPFLSTDPEERRILFDAFLLQKALYEVAYELNNRPDWVRIPIRGILGLLS